MKKRAIIIVGIFAILAGLIAWRIISRFSEGEASNPRRGGRSGPIAVKVAPVRREHVRESGRFTGSIMAREQFIIAPEVPGRLEWLGVSIGDVVTNGQKIASLDSREYSHQVAQAAAQLEVAKAQVSDTASALDVAEKDLARVRQLREQHVASQSDLDTAESRQKVALARHAISQAQVRQQAAGLKTAEVRLAYTQIAATWTGNSGARVIGERFVDEGAMLRANDPIISVLDLDTVLARVFVVERDYSIIQAGQKAILSADALPGQTFTGIVARKAPLVKETSRQARIEIEIPNHDRLLVPGMFVRVEIAFAEREEATVVPVEALVRRNERDGVFLVDQSAQAVSFVEVELGAIGAQIAEIRSPHLEGLVVTLGQHLLEDGAAVRLPASTTDEKNRIAQ